MAPPRRSLRPSTARPAPSPFAPPSPPARPRSHSSGPGTGPEASPGPPGVCPAARCPQWALGAGAGPEGCLARPGPARISRLSQVREGPAPVHLSPNFNFLGQLLEYERSLKLLAALQGDGASPPQDPGAPAGPAAPLPPPPPPPTSESAANAASREAAPTGVRRPNRPGHQRCSRASAACLLRPPQDTNRLKRSFSLDIKSAYTPSRRPDDPGPRTPGAPKLCKLDSPSGGHVEPAFPSPDSPDVAPEPRPGYAGGPGPSRLPGALPGARPRPELRRRHPANSAARPLGPVGTGLPGPGQPAGPGAGRRRSTPGARPPRRALVLQPRGQRRGAGGARFAPFGRAGGRALAAATCGGGRRRRPGSPGREDRLARRAGSRGADLSAGLPNGVRGGHGGGARGEELALGKQASFSGSVEVIEVS